VHDAVIIGGGHNGLVAAALLARAGRSVLVLERRDHVGGAAVSERPWEGVDARLSRYAYLVSLFPRALREQLGLTTELRRRAVSSYSPRPDGSGLLVRAGAPPNPAFAALTERVGRAVFPTLTEPLPSRDELRARVGDDAWEALFERPLGETLAAHFPDEFERGIVATDALIGTFAGLDDESLRQNRCFLYHVIGNGTGDWDVPVGGMGALTEALAAIARAAGAELRLGAAVTGIETDGDTAQVSYDGGTVSARHVLANVAPAVLARLLGEPAPDDPAPEGAQLKVNMLLKRLPRLRDGAVDPAEAFAGTFHVNESAAQLEAAHAQARAARVPELAPCEIYCHSLTDPSILGAELREAGAQTLTCFALHMPARIFAAFPGQAKAAAIDSTLASLNSVLAEPIEDCLWTTPEGAPCIEARTPPELEAELGLPGGNIFHRDLAWPFAEDESEVGSWGVETAHANVFLCGAGARRGGGVSGIPGHNAAMAVLHPRMRGGSRRIERSR
jgi:phytoene dehydrogenase-like protein